MASTLAVNVTVVVNGVPVTIALSQSVSASSMLKIDETIAGSTTNRAIACSIDEDALVGLVLVSDQAVTVKTNSSTEPQETITLAANVPLVWMTSSSAAKPIANDVTQLFVTNAGTVAANLTVIAMVDATP